MAGLAQVLRSAISTALHRAVLHHMPAALDAEPSVCIRLTDTGTESGSVPLGNALQWPVAIAVVSHAGALWWATSGASQRAVQQMAPVQTSSLPLFSLGLVAAMLLCAWGWQTVCPASSTGQEQRGQAFQNQCAAFATSAGLLAVHSVWLFTFNWAFLYVLLVLVCPLGALRIERLTALQSGAAVASPAHFHWLWLGIASGIWAATTVCCCCQRPVQGSSMPESGVRTLLKVWPWLAASSMPELLSLLVQSRRARH